MTAALLLLLLGCPSTPEPLPPAPFDRDGDGFDEDADCDDRDPETYPDAPEACDGLDQNCDGSTGDEVDDDGDGHRACAECDDARDDVHPGAPSTCDGSDADCDGAVSEAESAHRGAHEACPALDCAAVEGVETAWIDAGGDLAFEVDCDGPWVHLALDDSDAVLVASKSVDNGWIKCDDDAAAEFGWLEGEASVEVDSAPNRNHVRTVDAAYVGGASGAPIPAAGVRALAAHATELHPDERLVAVIGDNDGQNWQGGSGAGLEAYAVDAAGTWHLLSPGAGGDCGGGPASWPLEGSESSFYLWGTEGSEAHGGHNLAEPLEALAPSAALPVQFVLAVATGGGVAIGYSEPTFRVR